MAKENIYRILSELSALCGKKGNNPWLLFMQNKANFLNTRIDVSFLTTEYYKKTEVS